MAGVTAVIGRAARRRKMITSSLYLTEFSSSPTNIDLLTDARAGPQTALHHSDKVVTTHFLNGLVPLVTTSANLH